MTESTKGTVKEKYFGEKLEEGLYRIKCLSCGKVFHTCFGDEPCCSLQCRDALKIAKQMRLKSK